MSYFILAVPMGECMGKHSCMSSSFPIAMLNGTSSFLSLVQENINMPADTIIGLVSEVAVKNHIIKLNYCCPYSLLLVSSRGWVDDLSFFEYLSRVCFLLIEFHCTFSISSKLLPYFVCYYSILIG